MNSITRFFFYSNFFISLCAFALTLGIFCFEEVTFILLIPNAIFSFLSVFAFYNFQRLFLFQYYKERQETGIFIWLKSNRLILIFFIALVFCLLLPLCLAVILDNLFLLILIAFFSVLYFFPLFPIRNFIFIKPFYVSFFWVIICIVIPWKYMGLGNTLSLILLSIAQFIFIASLCIQFDVRDMKLDLSKGVKTLPMVLGIKNAKLFSAGMMLVYSVIMVKLNLHFFVPVLLTLVLSVALIFLNHTERKQYHYLFLLDGCILFQVILFLLWKNFM